MSLVHLEVALGSESYALPVEQVLEVAEETRIDPVPGAPRGVLGVRTIRGRVLPVLDLAVLLGVPGGASGPIVVAEAGGRRACLAVDAVAGVVELPAPTQQAHSPLLTGAVITEASLVGVICIGSIFDAAAGQERHDE